MRWPMRILSGLLAVAAMAGLAIAETREYDLVVDEGEVEIAGKPRHAMTLNGSVPGPTLRFKVGDEAVIHVRNRMKVETSIHWHGLLVPNSQDGVPYLTTPPIAPGTTFTYRFPIKHSGTYWYHSHTGLQEQVGVYGSIVITPEEGEPVKADREHVVVLSDWTDEDPYEVMRTLMRGSDWYSVRKGTLPTIAGAWREGKLGSYFRMQWNRMPPMDISDVAYDAFVANGKERLDLEGRPGETIRLRIIDAAASTNFFLNSSLGPLTIVAADGPSVEPYAVDGFMIAIAETYDVLVEVPAEGTWEIRATAQDGTGHASMYVGSGPEHAAPDIPKPDLYSMDHLLGGAMESLGHGKGARGHEGHGQESAEAARPLSPYRGLRAVSPTRAREGAPVREIELRLTGDMIRYIWSFNGKTLAEDGTIRIRQGEVLRIALVNDTMMNHPLHLHGHFFRVLDGDDEEAPLKHTVDVPPMGRRLIEFDANETGDWFFHCHVLYHMDAGMARVFSYGPPQHEPTLDPAMSGQAFLVGEATVLSNMSSGRAMVMKGRDDLGVSWDLGYSPKETRHHGPEYEADAYWEHFFDENLAATVGGRLTNEEDANDRAFAGVSYRLPLLARARLEADSRGDLRLGLTKDFQITDRFELSLSGHYDTGSRWEGRVGLDYTLSKAWSLTVEAHSDHGVGAGFTFRF
ncbi:MAG: multicopper oxidase domain-containing protein [Planctomycetaceae bacterium]|nr:multicopper oxidase domain-containing protein [Planctomycetota bacterium]NUN51174.1 multicopper oxidase domain-containing protein [Planctomycetaceae bacterium]